MYYLHDIIAMHLLVAKSVIEREIVENAKMATATSSRGIIVGVHKRQWVNI